MGYKNPFTILGMSVAKWADASPEQLRRKKKEFLAALDMSHDAFLHLNEYSLGKQDLYDMFDELESEQLRNFHVLVAQQPRLHTFLINSRLDYFYDGDISSFSSYPKEFIEWISPWFAESYNVRLLHAYRQRDLDELSILTVHSLPFDIAVQAQAYRDTYQLLDEHRQSIQVINDQISAGAPPQGELYELSEDWLISALNLLPPYFSQLRDGIGEALEQLAVSVYRRHQRGKLSLLIIRQALKLSLSPSVSLSLRQLQASLFRMYPEEEWKSWLNDQRGEGINPWLVAAGVGALGIAVWLVSKWRG